MHRLVGSQLLRALPLVLALAGASLSNSPAAAATVNIYGRVDIGGLPQPPVLVLPTPVIIDTRPVVVQREPVYLHVPPGHRKHWSKHCASYNACGERVYFVQDDWYQRVYVPERERRGPPPPRHDERDYERHYEHYSVRPAGPPGHEKEHGDQGKHEDRGDHGHKGKGH